MRFNQSQSGYSLLELLVALAMVMVLTTMAVPAVTTAISSAQLRAAAGGLAGTLQKARMISAAADRAYALRVSGSSTVYIDLNGNSTLDASENINLLRLPRGVVFDASAPALNAGFGASVTALPGFDPRGLPCAVSGSTCNFSQGTGFLVYLRQDRPFGATSWAAVSVSPAGRIKTWMWSGTAWQ
jgi:Tfp pilus assembly protein FimT